MIQQKSDTTTQRVGDCSLVNCERLTVARRWRRSLGRISENTNIPATLIAGLYHQLKTDGIFVFNFNIHFLNTIISSIIAFATKSIEITIQSLVINVFLITLTNSR